jgi:hypothetical protein
MYRFKTDDSRQAIFVRSWVTRLSSDSCWFVGPQVRIDGCLVKVSHKTVHDTLVPVEECWRALSTLPAAGGATDGVLLACAFITRRCLVTVMTDQSHYQFESISQHKLDPRHHRRLFWSAFSNLVESVLLPMAPSALSILTFAAFLTKRQGRKIRHSTISTMFCAV